MTSPTEASGMAIPPMEPAYKTSVRLARQLAAHISDNELADGTKLPPEAEMASMFRVGRSTLREALRLLETRGVVEIRVGRGGGPVVRKPKTTDLVEGLALALQFQKATLSDIVDARIMLEPGAARHSAKHVTPELLEDLRESVNVMQAQQNGRVFGLENRRFHSLIAHTIGNPVVSIYVDCLTQMHDGRPLGIEYASRHVNAVCDAHLEIIAALEARDPDLAEAAMRTHLEETRAYWSRKYADFYKRPLRWLEID